MTVMTLLCSWAVKFYFLKGTMFKKNMYNYIYITAVQVK